MPEHRQPHTHARNMRLLSPSQHHPRQRLTTPTPQGVFYLGAVSMTKYYIGTKQILAWPQDKDGAPGYAVKYPDGYTSWSPKEVFEAAYLLQGDDPTRITPEMVDAFILGHEGTRMGNHSVVLAKLRNGFTIVEDSACVDPANYDQSLGEHYALEKVKRKVWELLGFLLATARNGVDRELTPAEKLPPHQFRMLKEKVELDQKVAALVRFINGPKFPEVDPAEQDRLKAQANAMQSYVDILEARLAAVI